MIILGYVGNHAKDSLSVRIGWAATRLVQRGEFRHVTHMEAFFGMMGEQACIGSSSLRDGGVRIKQAKLSRPDWVAIDVPAWDQWQTFDFIKEREGAGYDLRGALATVLPGHQDNDRWFCNEIIGASVGLDSPEIFGPAQFMSIALSMPGAKLIEVPN